MSSHLVRDTFVAIEEMESLTAERLAFVRKHPSVRQLYRDHGKMLMQSTGLLVVETDEDQDAVLSLLTQIDAVYQKI